MKKDYVGKSASFKEEDDTQEGTKRRRVNGCLSFREISIDPTVKSLKHLDSQKLKDEIRKWAKAVVVYARQVSRKFGSSRISGSNE
ncbi:hypothetical protein CDL12_15635 [Handroanthus impetiginosus]|uniref:Uncharacterized protein n=1 Tax=Handroanthus impetiginosus TaxID=429701 RepID=A0A2G9H2M1_9LAMI|nr:hypothetical protein CDL12_15635 [Handroanthus impetiginosus]